MADPRKDVPQEEGEALRQRRENADRVTRDHEAAREQAKREVAERNEKAQQKAKRIRRELERYRANRRKGLEF